MASVNIYLTFNGNCREAFDFYKTVFGGEYSWIGTFGDMPPQEGFEVVLQDKTRIMHMSLPISKETILMGSDIVSTQNNVTFGDNFSISVDTDSRDEADRIFKALSDEGTISMPQDNMFWGSYFGMLTDKFGINWMVSFDTGTQE